MQASAESERVGVWTARARRRPLVAWAWIAALLGVSCWTKSARAVDVELEGSTVAQAYEVASPWGYELERRRLLQQVGFSLYHLQGKYVPGKPDYNVRVLFRVDADFGLGAHLPSDQSSAETNFETLGGIRYVPGLTPTRLDLMTAYVEGRNVANGFLTFRAGRQYVTDVLGWWSFDGALLRLQTPAFFDVEAYGGFEQRGGIPLSTGRFEPQGVWRGSHDDFVGEGESAGDGKPLASYYPSFQFASYAPAFGVAVESSGPNWLHARATYRRVYNTGEAFTQQYPDPVGGGYHTVDGLRVSSEKVGGAVNINKTDLGGIKGGVTYDLYNQVFATAYGGIEAYIKDKVTIGLDADHYEPTFDADSIFNWFTHNPTTTATGRVEARFTKEIDLSAQGGVRLWGTEGDPNEFGAAQCKAELEREAAVTGIPADGRLPSDCVGTPFDVSGASLAESDGAKAASRDEANRTLQYVLDGLGQLAARYRSPLGKLELRGMLQLGDRGHRAGGDVIGEKSFEGGRYSLGARFSVYDFGDGDTTTHPEDPNTTSFSYVVGAGFKPIDLSAFQVEFEHDINERVGQRFRLLGRLDILWAY